MEEIRNVIDHCQKCPNMVKLLNKKRNDEPLNDSDIKDIRIICMHCKCGQEGIYKADAIMTALLLHDEVKRQRNVGKKPTRYKQYKAAVQNLRNEGRSIREIAKILGISPTTVQRILKQCQN